MVFETSSKRRWRVALATAGLLGMTLALVLGTAAYRAIAYPPIPPEASFAATPTGELPVTRESTPGIPAYDTGRLTRTAFFSDADPNSVASLKRHVAELDAVFPLWFTFTGAGDTITESVDAAVLEFLRTSKALVLPRLANIDAKDRWAGQMFSTYLREPRNRSTLCAQIRQVLDRYDLPGVNVDIEAIRSSARDDYTAFIAELAEVLHATGKYLTVDLPLAERAYDYGALAAMADAVVIMGYDEHAGNEDPGPVASQAWFEKGVRRILEQVPREKLIVSLGQYSYDWNITDQTSTSLGFGEALALAQEAKAHIVVGKPSWNGTFGYVDAQGDKHEVWMLDAVTLWNQMGFLSSRGVYGVSLWRLGLEEPTIWNFYGSAGHVRAPSKSFLSLSGVGSRLW